MLLEVVMVSVLVGVVLTLLMQTLLMRWYFYRIPPQEPQDREQFPGISLPKILLDKLTKDPGVLQQKEACLWLNLIVQFLFQELRDTSTVRRWVMRKMNFEFAELMQTTSGKLLVHIFVRDFSLGSKCPVVGRINVQKVELGEEDHLECLDVNMDVDYEGGFTLGVDVMLPFNKQAFISVTIRRLMGRARLQLTRTPYTHWSFSFLQEPDVSFDVESHFGGRPLPQVAALIVNQLRRTIRKKHTLPNYKMRFKPVFQRPEVVASPCRLLVNGQCITVGRLCVTFIKCSRLPTLSKDTTLYCILSTDTKPWKELVRGQHRVWVTYDVEVNKGQADSIGMNFKDDYLMDRYGMAVVVDLVQLDSCAAKADIRKGDVLISVGTTRIVSTKQAAKLFKNAGEKFMVRLERPQVKLSQDTKFQEDSILFRDGEAEVLDDALMEDGEEFINISVQPSLQSQASSTLSVSSETMPAHKGSPPVTAAQLLRPKSATDISTMAAVALQRPKQASADSTPPGSSPRLKRRSGTAPSQAAPVDVNAKSDTASLTVGSRSRPQGHMKKDHSPGRDSIRSESLQPDRKEEEAKSMCSIDSDSDDESPVMYTKEVPASQNPRWHDPLSFDLREHHAFLNVCVWCHNTEHTDIKPDRPPPPPHRDLLLGQVSIPVNTLVLQCLMTMQGDTKQTLELQPGQIKAGASRKSGAGYIGFEPHRCYGDITLRFQFTPSNVSKDQRQIFARDLDPADPSDLGNAGIEMEVRDSSQEELSDAESQTEEGRHLFSRAQFSSATYCNFCGKKIWMKNAFQCSACNMISHKKCIEKCRAETLCSSDGPRRRSAPGEFWRTPTATRKQSEEEAGSSSPRQQTRSSRLLSKLKGVNKAEAPKPDSSPVRSRPHDKTKTRASSEPSMPTDLQFLDGTLDDAAMNSAKQLGRQLFSQLEISERKARLDHMVNKMQIDIDQESAHKAQLTQQLKAAETHSARGAARLALAKSNEKIEALMLLLLQYCAGLQHCLDTEEERRQQLTSSTAVANDNAAATGAAADADAAVAAAVGSAASDVVDDSAASRSEKTAAVTDEIQEEVVTQVLTELIHTAEEADEDDVDDDDSSSSAADEDEDEEDEVVERVGVGTLGESEGVEHFRPIFQTNGEEGEEKRAGPAPAPAPAPEAEAPAGTTPPGVAEMEGFSRKVLADSNSNHHEDADEELEESTSV